MPLSPFCARLALVAFAVIAVCIGTNLLVMQTTTEALSVFPQLAKAKWSPVDSDQLGRRALDALIRRETSAEPAGGAAATSSRKPAPSEAGQVQRLGSFAPSSGQIAFSALPGVDPAEARRATIRGVQQELARRGYEPGTADGTPGLVTRAAVMAYEHDQGLPLTADPSPEVLAHLRHGTSAPGAAIGLDANAPRTTGSADQVIRAVQQTLGQLGYMASAPDGLTSDETVRAIREFEMDSGLVPSGRISGPLVARLTKQAAGQKAR